MSETKKEKCIECGKETIANKIGKSGSYYDEKKVLCYNCFNVAIGKELM
ncbi:unnamed protein product [marine sediment metagenome]|uniref:Uncharacterized protein n=1 Tax=marine sediment metagenome TaxID=412755 RepID=X0RU09_9ZZZZ